MASGVNGITKIGIIVVSVILGFFAAYNLYVCLTNGQSFGETDKIIDLVKIGAGLALCILAFWGAYTENACLCYIALVFCAIIFALGVWGIIQCLIGDTSCDSKVYIIHGIYLVISGILVIAVYMFIQSIK